MGTRSSRSTVRFSRPFVLSGYTDELPAGDYEVVITEDHLQGATFEAYRRTATYLSVRGVGCVPGRTEMRQITEKDLEAALGRDRASANDAGAGDAALSPQEDLI